MMCLLIRIVHESVVTPRMHTLSLIIGNSFGRKYPNSFGQIFDDRLGQWTRARRILSRDQTSTMSHAHVSLEHPSIHKFPSNLVQPILTGEGHHVTTLNRILLRVSERRHRLARAQVRASGELYVDQRAGSVA